MNALESIRIGKGLTYEALGELAGYIRPVAWKHCHLSQIPVEAAIRYAAALGIPLAELRPDLPSLVAVSAPTPEARP